MRRFLCGGSGPDFATPDGKCIICNHVGRSSTIKGGSIDEIICGEDGDDTIEGRGGNDILMGGTGRRAHRRLGGR